MYAIDMHSCTELYKTHIAIQYLIKLWLYTLFPGQFNSTYEMQRCPDTVVKKNGSQVWLVKRAYPLRR